MFAVLVLSLVSPADAQDHEHVGGIADLTDRLVDVWPVGDGMVGKTPTRIVRTEELRNAFSGAVVRLCVSPGDEPGEVWFRFVASESQSGEWHKAVLLGDGSSGIVLAAARTETALETGAVEIALSSAEAEVLEAAVFDNRDDEDSQDYSWDPAQTATGKTSGLIVTPRLINREEWGASPFRGTPVPLARPSYDQITFHHAACCGAYTYEEGIEQVKWIQGFHQDGRGWSDIGYQFLLDQSGRLYQGRPFMNDATLDETPILAQGAHVGGFNTGNIGISVLGCYHPPEGNSCTDILSPAAYDSLVAAIAFFSERYEIPPSQIFGHRDFSSTACPGDNNYTLLPQIRRQVADLLVTGNAPVGSASLTALSDADGVVQVNWQFTRDDGIVSYAVQREAGGNVDVLFESNTVEDLSIVDGHVKSAGPVLYVLRARNEDGRWLTIAATEVDVAQPDEFQLSQSFPNPTGDRATIRYFLEREGVVDLALFDLAGRRVAGYVREFQSAGRWYSVDADLSRLPSGVYHYRIVVEGFTDIVFDEARSLTITR